MWTWICPSCGLEHFKNRVEDQYTFCIYTHCPKSLAGYVVVLNPVKCIGCMRPWLCKTKVLVQ